LTKFNGSGASVPKRTAVVGNIFQLVEEHPLASTYWDYGRWKEVEQLQLQVMETRKEGVGAGASRHATPWQSGVDTLESGTMEGGR